MRRARLLKQTFVCGLAVLVAACAAGQSPTDPSPLPTSLAEPTFEAMPTPLQTEPPAIPERRMLVLEWPAKMRQGDSDVVRLTLEMDEQGNLVPTALVEGHSTTGEVVEVPNLYDTHTVLAEARLDMAGMAVAPDDLVGQALLPGKSVTFLWSVHPSEASLYKGNVWFYLRFIPKSGGPEIQRAVASLPVEIRAANLVGLSGQPARWVGAIGSLIGGALGVDTVVEFGWKTLRRKRVAR